MSPLTGQIVQLAHLESSIRIAEELGCSPRYVRRVLRQHGLNNPAGPPRGDRNPSWRGGRMVDLDGYVLLQTKPTRVSEHRHVAAQTLGRELLESEVVDHIDGITIHNDPKNLRVFATNGVHLRATITGRDRSASVSNSGRRNIKAQKKNLVGTVFEPVDTYRLRKERGDVRLRAILRAALELGKEHPCLSGTTHWLKQTGIDPSCDRSLERAWAALESRYAEDLLL